MENEKTKYVSVMPDFSRPEVWMPLVKAMMEGHQKQTAKTVRFQSKQMLTSVFFSHVLSIAKDQQEFWKTIEEVATTELRYLKEQGDE